ncbi:cytochrome c [Candidatus Gracilibacteria bacterium]|nr:cytochrome c [Candidatus Gracilibacteria bacterium]
MYNLWCFHPRARAVSGACNSADTAQPRGRAVLNVAPLQTTQAPLIAPVVAPPRGPTALYGDYLLSISGCRDCHASNLAGVPPGSQVLPGPNLTDLGQRYDDEQFIRLLRAGVKADGTLLGEGMLYYDYELFDDDFRAIFAYIQSIEPLPDNEAIFGRGWMSRRVHFGIVDRLQGSSAYVCPAPPANPSGLLAQALAEAANLVIEWERTQPSAITVWRGRVGSMARHALPRHVQRGTNNHRSCEQAQQ